MSRFTLDPTPLAGLVTVQRQPLVDSRGFLARMFCAQDLAPAGWTWPIAQINHTLTAQRGTVRGLHFQHPPAAEAKLVSCLRGAVWDVAVDLRAGSPTFLQWFGTELSAANHRALLIPPGFAHGFQALSDGCEMLYLHSAPHAPASEGGLDALDPRLAIAWPLPVAERSPRDAEHPLLAPGFTGLPLS
ncbi:dTDP-4-dehydrorhamnose 3,5-epimerase family protein [Acidovorax sp.]|uniref:dTDP-4-dehydrorhamnose 3,5-epimerase family protein n=1 Tax=Acidovorax sp. TaxID=1872122 RepID=UPI002ACE023B|nr:dTDP-4-dehydrorhamnose 3,5-epimerase family protein [Acidovorax sp.]MDZ7861827.1 dTDP-4-dehydrorhamnose 3,5-epimerase family protein [Acidovorax sp.]